MALITKETAAEMGRKGAKARLDREEQLRQAIEFATKNPVVGFAERTLARVRLQMDRLSTEIDQEITGESKRLKELTDSYARLADQERILAGRPLPGSRKPAPDKPGKRQSTPTPQPVVDEQTRQSNPDEPNG